MQDQQKDLLRLSKCQVCFCRTGRFIISCMCIVCEECLGNKSVAIEKKGKIICRFCEEQFISKCVVIDAQDPESLKQVEDMFSKPAQDLKNIALVQQMEADTIKKYTDYMEYQIDLAKWSIDQLLTQIPSLGTFFKKQVGWVKQNKELIQHPRNKRKKQGHSWITYPQQQLNNKQKGPKNKDLQEIPWWQYFPQEDENRQPDIVEQKRVINDRYQFQGKSIRKTNNQMKRQKTPQQSYTNTNYQKIHTRDHTREHSREHSREYPRQYPKEYPREYPQEHQREYAREFQREYPRDYQDVVKQNRANNEFQPLKNNQKNDKYHDRELYDEKIQKSYNQRKEIVQQKQHYQPQKKYHYHKEDRRRQQTQISEKLSQLSHRRGIKNTDQQFPRKDSRYTNQQEDRSISRYSNTSEIDNGLYGSIRSTHTQNPYSVKINYPALHEKIKKMNRKISDRKQGYGDGQDNSNIKKGKTIYQRSQYDQQSR